MQMQGTAPADGRRPDPIAILAMTVVAILALAAAWTLPWWVMEARAPQYGQRVLVVKVNPAVVSGDVFELDTLGHYVGIKPLASLAPVERKLAPLGFLGSIAGILLAPWLRRRWLRMLVILPALTLPAVFLVDLSYWMNKSVSQRDLEAALNLTVTSVEPRILGSYEVGQFQVLARAEGGLYLAGLAGLLGFGIALGLPLVRRRAVHEPAAAVTAGAAVAAALVLSALATPVVAAERALAPAESIAVAVASAGDGDTLVIPAGIHRERLVIARRIQLRGEPGAILDGGGEGTVVTIRASGVELRGLTLRASGESYLSEDAGVRIEGASDVRLSGLRLEDVLFGVYAAQTDRLSIEDSTIVGKDLLPERRGDAIRLWYSNGCRIARNHIERSRDVVIWYSSDTIAEDNVVVKSRYGLHYMYSDRNVFRRNRFDDNQVGASIMYSRGLELSDNSFSFSNGPGGHGLLVKEADDIFIRDNRFIGNGTALFFDDSPQSRGARAEVKGNWIARNDVGVALQPLTRRIEFSENAFVGNGVQVQMLGTGTADGCAWSVAGRGNYWSDAIVYDADHDGVSELPYRLESTWEALSDRVPALAFFAGTPAAEAIDLGARMFPIFAPRPKLTDPHPLVHPPVTPAAREGERSDGSAMTAAGSGLLSLVAAGAAVARRSLA